MGKKAWRTREVEYVRDQYPRGVPLQDIADKLGRSIGSVKSMIQRLGLHRGASASKTTIKPLQPAEYSLSLPDAFKLMSGLLLRLQNGSMTRDEIKFFSVAVTALKTYLKYAEDYGAVPGEKPREEHVEDEPERMEDDGAMLLEKIQQMRNNLSWVERRIHRRRTRKNT